MHSGFNYKFNNRVQAVRDALFQVAFSNCEVARARLSHTKHSISHSIVHVQLNSACAAQCKN